MAFWDAIANLFRAPPAAAKSTVITYWPTDAALHTVLDGTNASTSSLMDTLQTNELVFACLSAKATAAQDPTLRVEQAVTRGRSRTYEPLPDHPLRQLMIRPGPNLSEADLMQAAIVSWDISNPRRFFCRKIYDRGTLVGLEPLNPARMRERTGATGRQVIGYDCIESDGARTQYALDDLIIRSSPRWYDPPPLVAALGSVASDSAQTDYIAAFFANGGIPAGFLKYGMPLNDPQRDEIRQKWRAIYGAARRGQHDVGILDANADWVQSGLSLDALDSETLRQVAESRIAMVFGVPPLIVYAYVGLVRATYSNLKEAWASFWDATMAPAFKEWRDFWSWTLLVEFAGERAVRAEQLRLAYDMSAVAALQDDVDAAQNRARANFQAGGVTLNEYRAQIGQAPDPAGDYYVRPATALPTPAGAGGATLPALGRPRSSAKALPASTQPIERQIRTAVQDYLAAEYRAAAEALS